MELAARFRENWKRLVSGSDTGRVLLAVSGGADSMTMVQLFLDAEIPVALAHAHFGLRGMASDLDEDLVRTCAGRHDLAFHSVRFDTRTKMAAWKKGVQETARILRYEWLEQIRSGNGYGLIATAHHADDQAETMLMHLFRGTGIRGLYGIPERQGHIIRPLLFARKAELTGYAAAHGVAYREDASNDTDAYTRNIIRHHIIPAISGHFPDAVSRMQETAGRVAQAALLYRQAADTAIARLKEQRGPDVYIPLLKLEKVKPLETVCYELFAPYGFLPAQLPQLLQLLHAGSGHYVASATHRVIRDRGFLVITALPGDSTDLLPVDAVPCVVQAGPVSFRFSVRQYDGHLPDDPAVACLDMREVTFPLMLRKWRTGDYFYPLGMGMKKKKLARFFIDRKLPVHEKEQVWVLESARRIAWVAGMRPDERFRVRPSTTAMLVAERLAD